MSTWTEAAKHYAIELKSPMGWIKIYAELTDISETAFRGEAKLLGQSVPLTDCVKNGQNYTFKAAPKLPFGVLEVDISAEIHDDGTVTGVATAPHYRPMEIKGAAQ